MKAFDGNLANTPPSPLRKACRAVSRAPARACQAVLFHAAAQLTRHGYKTNDMRPLAHAATARGLDPQTVKHTISAAIINTHRSNNRKETNDRP